MEWHLDREVAHTETEVRPCVCENAFICPWERTESVLTHRTLIVAKAFIFDTMRFQGFQVCTDRNPLKACLQPLFILYYMHSSNQRGTNCTFSPLYALLCTEFQVVFLLKKRESIIGAQALHIISIFIWGITPHRPDNLAPQIPSLSLSALVSQWVITRLSWFGLKGSAV